MRCILMILQLSLTIIHSSHIFALWLQKIQRYISYDTAYEQRKRLSLCFFIILIWNLNGFNFGFTCYDFINVLNTSLIPTTCLKRLSIIWIINEMRQFPVISYLDNDVIPLPYVQGTSSENLGSIQYIY